MKIGDIETLDAAVLNEATEYGLKLTSREVVHILMASAAKVIVNSKATYNEFTEAVRQFISDALEPVEDTFTVHAGLSDMILRDRAEWYEHLRNVAWKNPPKLNGDPINENDWVVNVISEEMLHVQEGKVVIQVEVEYARSRPFGR